MAEFVCSDALRSDEFLTLVNSYKEYSMIESSGVDEFNKIIKILLDRNLTPKFAISERLINHHTVVTAEKKYECNVVSLSPSDKSILLSKIEISKLLPKKMTSKLRINSQTPNHTSVVITIKIDDIVLLLGSDLENTNDADTGWQVIVNQINDKYGKASFYKVPHHGSESSYNINVWQQMLCAEPIAVLTPFHCGRNILPTKIEVDRIVNHTSKSYSTAKIKAKKRKRENMVERTIRETAVEIHDVIGGIGQIRYRKNLINEADSGDIQLFGSACLLKDIM